MSISKLPTNYVDEVVSGTRKYNMIENQDDTVSFEDQSTYTTEGSGFGASDINATNGTVNSVIDLAEANAGKASTLETTVVNILNGTTTVPSATNAQNATSATTADTATRAGTATTADTASSATTAGTANTASTAQSVDNDFILCTNQDLTFTNGVCTLLDARITANSLADVYFTASCINEAQKSVITVETSAGAVTLTAGRTPTSTLTATIRIRVV